MLLINTFQEWIAGAFLNWVLGQSTQYFSFSNCSSPKLNTNAHILIVGGGAAGIAMANRFSHSLQGAKITMLGERQPHIYQPGQI